MDFLRNFFGGSSDTPPDPSEASAEDVSKYVEQWTRQHPRDAAKSYDGSDSDPTVQMPYAKAIDDDGTRYKSEFPWLYDPAKGVRWDFDPIELRVLAQENAWVGMLVQSITKEIAETSWTITDSDDATETQKRLSTHPEQREPVAKELPDAIAEDIYNLLKNPNPDHDWYDVVEMWMADLLEVGSMAAVKAYPSDAYDDEDNLVVDPAALTPRAIMPSAPEVWTKDYGDKSGVLDGYWQFDNHSSPGQSAARTRGVGQPIPFDRSEVVWSDMAPRTNRRYGMPPTLLVRDFLQSLDLAVTQEQQYLSRGSIPSGAWVFEAMDMEQMKDIRSEFRENVKGKPHKSLFLGGEGGDVKFEPMSMNFKELEFTERMRWYARVVASAFQVPTAVVGIEPEKINYNTFQSERENFESNTLGPYLQQLERIINGQIIQPHWGRDYRFEFTPGMSETTRDMISQRVSTEFNNNLATRNEARRELGREPVDESEDGFKADVVEGDEGGDVKFEPMSMNFKELEFTERMRWYARVVASAFQVPTAVVGIEPEKINYNTFQSERENFESNTLGPYLQQLERIINGQIIQPHWGRDYRFEFTPGMSETTRDMISQRVSTEFNNNLTTRNEARRELGREPVDESEGGFKADVVEGDDGGDLGGLLSQSANMAGGSGNVIRRSATPEGIPSNASRVSDSSECTGNTIEGPRGGLYCVPEGEEGVAASPEEAAQEVQEIVNNSDSPTQAVEQLGDYLESATGAETVDLSGFDAERAADISEATATLAAVGETENINAILSEPTEQMNEQDAAGNYDPFSREIRLNPESLSRENIQAWAENNHLAGDSIQHIVIHEIGHHRHFQKRVNGESAGMQAQTQTIPEDAKPAFAEAVSTYSIENANEMVAELYAMQVSGEELTTGMKNAYELFNGPEVNL